MHIICRICSKSAITHLKKCILISCTILLILEHCVKPGWDTLGEGYSCVLGQRLDAEGNGQNDFTFRLRYLFAWVRPPSWEPNATHFESWTERISILLEEEEGSFGSKLAKWKGDHYENWWSITNLQMFTLAPLLLDGPCSIDTTAPASQKTTCTTFNSRNACCS